MHPSHALFYASGIPWNVIVYEEPAELKVDPLPRCVGSDKVARSVGVTEELSSLVPLLVVHAPMDGGNLAGQPESLESAGEELHRVAVLSEDEHLGLWLRLQRFPEALEFAFVLDLV